MEEKENQNKTTEIKISSNIIDVLLSCLAVCILIIYRIILNFGVFSTVLNGIMSIVIYSLAGAGFVLNSMKAGAKPNKEFWVSLVAFVVCFICA